MFALYTQPAIQRQRSRPSFTLVELMVGIAIIGILTSMVLYTLAGAQRDSLIAKTQGTIRKLNEIVLFRWEEFRYRSVNIRIPPDFLTPFALPSGEMVAPLSAREGARVRTMILRDTMRMELPDRYSDILFTPSRYTVALRNAVGDFPYYPKRDVPGIYNNFRKSMTTIPLSAILDGADTLGNPYDPQEVGVLKPGITSEYQGAELLYQIVATSNYNGGNGLDFFASSEIADTDGDGMPEFIDGWGNPIRWLRWPAGYGLFGSADSRPNDSLLNDATVPDPLDPLRTDWRWSDSRFTTKPWMLVPLIISAGPDGMFDIQFDEKTTSSPTLNYATLNWAPLVPPGSPAHNLSTYYFVDPYYGFYDNKTGREMLGGLGSWFDQDGNSNTIGAADNITNYSLILQ